MLRLPNANPAQGWRAITLIGVSVLALCATACTQPVAQGNADENLPQQAGQPLNPVAVAGHIASIRVAALTGDQRAVQANVKAFSDDFRRSIKLPDPARPIDHEAARAAVRPLVGVRSSVWMDRSNLIVMVDGAQYRSPTTINRVCNALAPLGDTLAVVVNVQNVNAKTSQEADTLSRNCQLPEGERAFLQPKRQIDALDPATRRAFEAQQGGAAKKEPDRFNPRRTRGSGEDPLAGQISHAPYDVGGDSVIMKYFVDSIGIPLYQAPSKDE